MDPKDKKKITEQLTALLKLTSFDTTLETKLIEKNIFTHEMLERIKRSTNTNTDNARQLYLEVPKRGPRAFENLVLALVESGNVGAARILDPNVEEPEEVNGNVVSDIKVWNEPQYGSNVVELSLSEQLQRELYIPPPVLDNSTMPIEVSVRKATAYRGPPSFNAYPLFSKPRGLALIIDNEDFDNNVLPRRTGSMVDANNLDILLSELGFKVTLRRNLSYRDMMIDIKTFATNPQHAECDMTVVCILSHGRHGLIASADGREVETEWVLRQFNNDGCPSLRGKPKWFILQACRGDEADYGILPKIEFAETSDAVDARPMAAAHIPKDVAVAERRYKEPSWEDMLIAYATLPGYVANRDIYRGTWFIECICQVLMDLACDTDLRDMLDEVGRRLTSYETDVGTKQSFSYEVRHFYKKLYFNPGMDLGEIQKKVKEDSKAVKRRPRSRTLSESEVSESPSARPLSESPSTSTLSESPSAPTLSRWGVSKSSFSKMVRKCFTPKAKRSYSLTR